MRDTKALQQARDMESDPYRRRFTYPKWNGTVTVTDEPRLFARLPEFNDWTPARHEAVSREYAIIGKLTDGMYFELISQGLKSWGDGDGQLISGIYRSHFPELFKSDLRTLAHHTTEYYARSYAHWQAAGKRAHTWRQMRDDLAV